MWQEYYYSKCKLTSNLTPRPGGYRRPLCFKKMEV